MRIAQSPRDTWGAQVALIQKGCPHADCGEPRCCNTRITEYMRMQYRILARQDRVKAAGA